jgi:hypothetical protein
VSQKWGRYPKYPSNYRCKPSLRFRLCLCSHPERNVTSKLCRWLTRNDTIYFRTIKGATTPNRLSPTRPSPICPLVSSGTRACGGYYFAELFHKYPTLTAVYPDGSLSQRPIGCVFLYHIQDYRYSLQYNNRVHMSEINATYGAHPCIRRQFR